MASRLPDGFESLEWARRCLASPSLIICLSLWGWIFIGLDFCESPEPCSLHASGTSDTLCAAKRSWWTPAMPSVSMPLRLLLPTTSHLMGSSQSTCHDLASPKLSRVRKLGSKLVSTLIVIMIIIIIFNNYNYYYIKIHLHSNQVPVLNSCMHYSLNPDTPTCSPVK